MGFSDILLTLILILTPSVKGLYYEQEMFIFQIVVFITFSAFLTKNRRIKLNRPLDFTVLAFMAAYLFSVPGAADLREALLAVMRVITYVMIYLMVAFKAREDSGRLYILRTVYLSGTLVVVATLLNLLGIISTSEVWDGSIIRTTFEYKNTGALFLLVCTLIGIYLGHRADSVKISVLIGIGNYLNMLMIIGTQSRAVWLLIPVAFLLLLPGLPAGKRSRAIIKAIISLFSAILVSNSFINILQDGSPWQALLLVAAGAGLSIAGLFGWFWLENRLISPKRVLTLVSVVITGIMALVVFTQNSVLLGRIKTIACSDYSFTDRFVFFKDAWKIIASHPVFGAGGRGWDILYLNIQSYGYYAENVHNDFIQIAVEAGILGLLAFILIWLAFFLTGWKNFRQTEPTGKETAWLVLTAGTAIMLHSLLDFDLAHSALAFVLWSFLGILRGQEDMAMMDGRASGRGTRKLSPVFLAVLAGGVIYSAVSLSFFTGDMFFARGEKSLELDDLLTTRDYFEKAETFDPWKTNTLVSLAQINLAMFERGDPAALDEAASYAEKAIRVRPNEPLSHSVFAAALFYKGDYARSVAETEKYLALHPMQLAAYEELAARYVNIGLALKEKGIHPEAQGYFDKALQIPGMIDDRLKTVSSHELDLWRSRNAEPVLTVTPWIKMYTGAAHLLLGNRTAGSELIAAAFEEEPENPQILIWNAVVLDLAGRKDQVRALLEQVSLQNPGIMQSYDRINKLVSKM